jgi:predicted HAD superfamily Cof-like phosphohydrolase
LNCREKSESYQRTERFMQLAGQATPQTPTLLDEKTRVLRARLILEEAMETILHGLGVKVKIKPFGLPHPTIPILISLKDLELEPSGQFDMVELVDGVCDVQVVSLGTLIAAGITDAEPQRLVDENNLAKFGPGGYRDPGGKWIKPPGHKPPDIAGAIDRQIEATIPPAPPASSAVMEHAEHPQDAGSLV